MLLRALHIYEKELGLEHEYVGATCNRLGELTMDQDDLPKVEELLRGSLNIREKKYGLQHPDVAQTCINLGKLLKKKGDMNSAKQHFQRSVLIREKLLGLQHPETKEAQDLLKECEDANLDSIVPVMSEAATAENAEPATRGAAAATRGAVAGCSCTNC